MAYTNNPSNGNGGTSASNQNGSVEGQELSAEDYAIISAGLTTLGQLFAFLSLVKAQQVTKETGGQSDFAPVLFVQSHSRKKAAKGKRRKPR